MRVSFESRKGTWPTPCSARALMQLPRALSDLLMALACRRIEAGGHLAIEGKRVRTSSSVWPFAPDFPTCKGWH